MIPVPEPEPNSGWDPHPARCPECSEIIDANRLTDQGWCQFHGVVKATYSFQETEMADEGEEA